MASGLAVAGAADQVFASERRDVAPWYVAVSTNGGRGPFKGSYGGPFKGVGVDIRFKG